VLFSGKFKASGEATILLSAKSQGDKVKGLFNSAKIASGEASALGCTKTQAYKDKAPLGSAKKASREAKIASCEARTPSGAKASCEVKLASGEASVALPKSKATTFSKTKKQIFAKRAKPKAFLQTLRPSVLDLLGLVHPDSDMNESSNLDLRDYLSNK